jgi:hypothetical protein
MRKLKLAILGLTLALATFVSAPAPASGQRPVCNLLCAIGYHCCVQGGQAACCPD